MWKYSQRICAHDLHTRVCYSCAPSGFALMFIFMLRPQWMQVIYTPDESQLCFITGKNPNTPNWNPMLEEKWHTLLNLSSKSVDSAQNIPKFVLGAVLPNHQIIIRKDSPSKLNVSLMDTDNSPNKSPFPMYRSLLGQKHWRMSTWI